MDFAPAHASPDPKLLPANFSAPVQPNAGETAPPARMNVYIDVSKVVMKRRLSGLPLTVVVPTKSYIGVFAHITPSATPGSICVRIGLKHRDAALDLELLQANSLENIASVWESWAQTLDLPMLIIDSDSSITKVNEPLSARPPAPRARRRIAALTTRPRFLVRRKIGRACENLQIHSGERELIARN